MKISILASLFFLGVLVTAVAQDDTTVGLRVRAIDKDGKPVPGLVSNDFSVLEDNRPMSISRFEERDSTAVKTGEELPQKRKLILAIDLHNTSLMEFSSVREELENFVDQLNPEIWEVMLATILASSPVEVVAFTDQFDEIHDALEPLKANTFRDQEITTRKREITDLVKNGTRGAKSRALELAQFYAQEERQIADQTLRGLAGFTKYLDNPEEHVVIIFISGGFNTRPGLQYVRVLEKAEGKKDFDEDVFVSRDASIVDKLPKQLGALLRRNATIYCLNTRGNFNPDVDHLTQESFDVMDRSMLNDYQEGMDQIADLTGGLSFKNSNDFQKPFATILADTISDYVISYKPDQHDGKEKYRKIEVKINKPGIKLRYRKGYWNAEKQG